MRRLFPVLLIALATNACARPAPVAAPGDPGSSSAAASAAAQRDGGGRGEPGARETTATFGGDGAPTARPGRPAGAKPRGTLRPFEVTVSSDCVALGGTMTVEVATPKNAAVSVVASYADNSYPPDLHWQPREANATGNVTYAWVIEPTTPRGRALVQILAYDDSGSGNYTDHFDVAAAC